MTKLVDDIVSPEEIAKIKELKELLSETEDLLIRVKKLMIELSSDN